MATRGALVEYEKALLGLLPNAVAFQFNPEQMSRSLALWGRGQQTEGEGRRMLTEASGQTGGPPTETISFTAHFSAADDLGTETAPEVGVRLFGVGPQLSALERMMQPIEDGAGVKAQAVDAVAETVAGDGESATEPRPRERIPCVLFVWGPNRVLPVTIRSMRIAEKQFDHLLNPVLAEVDLELEVVSNPSPTEDAVGLGALQYTRAARQLQATQNLTRAAKLVDIVAF